jgi:hypothetical protein
LTLDGFSSHLNVPSAMEAFHRHKIFIVKEEGDASDTNQPYDQSVAKSDKANIRHLLDSTRTKLGNVTQWDLIAVCIIALKKVKKESWIQSFRKVNLHPDFRVSFHEWLQKIQEKIETGERFFKERANSLFDALPAVWRNMTTVQRQECIQIIDTMKADAGVSESIWNCKNNVRKLLKHVPMDDIPKIRACYMVAKESPGVIVGLDSTVNDDALRERGTQVDCFKEFRAAALKLKELMDGYKVNKKCPHRQKQLFDHFTNFAARSHWKNGDEELQPSTWLNLDITDDQRRLLAPKPKDVVRGAILNDTMGEGAKKKLAKRRINFWDGNISSYSRVLNSEEQLSNMKEVNELTAVLGEIRAENEQERESRAKLRAVDAEQREKRKAAAAEAAEHRKANLMPQLIAVAEAACANEAVLVTASAGQLRDLLRFLFEPPTVGVSSMKKDALIAAAKVGLEGYKAHREQV